MSGASRPETDQSKFRNPQVSHQKLFYDELPAAKLQRPFFWGGNINRNILKKNPEASGSVLLNIKFL